MKKSIGITLSVIGVIILGFLGFYADHLWIQANQNAGGRSNTVRTDMVMSSVYPSQANGTALTASSTIWGLGSQTILIPQNTITRPFALKNLFIGATTAGTAIEMEFVLYASSSSAITEIGRTKLMQQSALGLKQGLEISTEIIPANTGIIAAMASSVASQVASTSVEYFIYQ